MEMDLSRAVFSILLVAVIAGQAAAQGSLEIIPLRHRTADQELDRPLRRLQIFVRFDGSGFREVSTGFEAIPRLAGDGVLVEIAQRRDTLARQQALSTTVSGRLDELRP